MKVVDLGADGLRWARTLLVVVALLVAGSSAADPAVRAFEKTSHEVRHDAGHTQGARTDRCDLTTELGALMVLDAVAELDADASGCNAIQAPYEVQLMPEPALTVGTGGADFAAVPG